MRALVTAAAVMRALVTAAALLLAAAPVRAVDASAARDPMRAPQRAGAAVSAAATSAAPPVRQLLLVDGQRYVVDAGRRRAVGEMLGDARIERIDDSAVFVRRAGQLQRLALFAGVTKKVVPEPAPAAVPPGAAEPPAASRTALGTTAAHRTLSTRR